MTWQTEDVWRLETGAVFVNGYTASNLRTPIGGVKQSGYRSRADHYGQPRSLFRLFDEGQRQRLFANIAAAMEGVPQFIVDRQLAHFDRADADYGDGVRRALEARSGRVGQASLTTGHAAAAQSSFAING